MFKHTAKNHSKMALVLNISGGKDSSVMLDEICTRWPGVKKYAVMADTGFEHEGATEWARGICAKYGLELHIVRNPNKTFLTMIEKRHQARPDVAPFPSASTRQCTSDLKRDPIATWIRQNVKEEIIVNCMGIRAEESPSRARRAVLARDKRLSKAGRTVWQWAPIHKMMLGEVLQRHSEKGIPLHRVYVWAGGYLTRFSCRMCVMMRDEEIRATFTHDRAAYDAMEALERKTGYTMKNGRSLAQIVAAGRPGAIAAAWPVNDCKGECCCA